jgi:hypothetical protein
MTSENPPGRRPPTIDLTATEVENPAAAKEAASDSAAAEAAKDTSPKDTAPGEPTAAADPKLPGNRKTSYALMALAGCIIVAGVVGALWFEGILPLYEPTPPAAATLNAVTAAANSGITARLDKIERTLQAQQQAAPKQEPAPIPPALTNRLTAAEAQAKSLSDSMAALNRRLDDIAATSQNAAKQAGAAAATAAAAKAGIQDSVKEAMRSAEQNAVSHSDIDAVTDRIAALENAVKALSENQAHQAAATNDSALRLSVAAAALKSEVERGAPYQAELAAAQTLGAAPDALAALAPFSASGVPSAAALARELAALVPELRRSAEAQPDDTVLGRLEANAQRLVRFAPIDATAGNDPASVSARIAIDAARADIAAAQTDIISLPDKAKPLAADWVKKAQARDAAIAASRRIAADALAALTKPAAP